MLLEKYCFDGLPISWTIGTSPNAELGRFRYSPYYLDIMTT